MKEVYIIDVMAITLENQVLYDIASVWSNLADAKEELKKIKSAVNATEAGILRAEIDESGEICSFESFNKGVWMLLSRYHIKKKEINFGKKR